MDTTRRKKVIEMINRRTPIVLSLVALSALILCACSNGSTLSGTFIARDADTARFDRITFQSSNSGMVVEGSEELTFNYNVVAGYIRFDPQDPNKSEPLPSKSVPFYNGGSSVTIDGDEYLLLNS